jgi:predicted kinase
MEPKNHQRSVESWPGRCRLSKKQGLLIILGGLPGTGKSSIARELAAAIGAVHVRIDTIENALRHSQQPMEVTDHGYAVASAVASDNLRLGHTVVADSVNPIAITRVAWRDVAARAGVPYFEVEIVCRDRDEHRRRVETRVPDIEGHVQPSWQEVVEREYEPWDAGLVIDTARMSVDEAVTAIQSALEAR